MDLNSNSTERKRQRWKVYDYSRAGAYFITIVCKDRRNRFGRIVTSANDTESIQQMELNRLGQVAFEEWQKLPDRFPWLSIDEFQIMPNHMHGILSLEEGDPLKKAAAEQKSKIGLLSQALGAYKSLVSTGCLDLANAEGFTLGKLWQRSFFDHIIRDERSYQRIARYIRNNPNNWGRIGFGKNRWR